MEIIACNAPYGGGGLGGHMAQRVAEAQAAGQPVSYFASATAPGDASAGHVVSLRSVPWLFRYTPLRLSPAWKLHVGNCLFDRAVARRLTAPINHFVGFSGQALASFRRARQLGCATLELVAPTAHVNHVRRQNNLAYRQWPIERGWLNEAQRRKAVREYEMADVIQVASEYIRQTFLQEGVAAAKIRRITLRADARFIPPATRPDDGVFRIVYTGSIAVVKGIPVLLEAFARLGIRQAQLTLVGGTGSRPMHLFMQRHLRQDPRIRMAPGDPLPHLQRADVYVHPSYQDGLGLAPLEAMACGVPVIVTDDTGMKEYVQEGVNGYVVPTGDSEAILTRLKQIWVAKGLGSRV